MLAFSATGLTVVAVTQVPKSIFTGALDDLCTKWLKATKPANEVAMRQLLASLMLDVGESLHAHIGRWNRSRSFHRESYPSGDGRFWPLGAAICCGRRPAATSAQHDDRGEGIAGQPKFEITSTLLAL